MKKRSLISNRKECLVCGSGYGVHRHHIFYGTANRKKSEEDGCWCYLCYYHHNGSDKGVHNNRGQDLNLKKFCQKKWEEKYGTREEFIKRYGRSYL